MPKLNFGGEPVTNGPLGSPQDWTTKAESAWSKTPPRVTWGDGETRWFWARLWESVAHKPEAIGVTGGSIPSIIVAGIEDGDSMDAPYLWGLP